MQYHNADSNIKNLSCRFLRNALYKKQLFYRATRLAGIFLYYHKNEDMFNKNEEAQQKIRDMVEEIKTCMFTTTDDACNVFSRPMMTVKTDNECCLWFFSDEFPNNNIINPEGSCVTLVFAHPGKNAYMNLHGTCYSLIDVDKMNELWIPAMKAWFPAGLDSPNLQLLKVCINEAYYWDNSTNEMRCLLESDTQKSITTEIEQPPAFATVSPW